MPDKKSEFSSKNISANDPKLQAIEDTPDGPEGVDSATPVKTSPKQQPKKSRKKVILFIIALLVILGIGGGVVAYMAYTNPEKVMLDAVQNSIKAKTTITDGNFKLNDTENNGNISVDFTSQSDTPNLAGSLDAKVKINYEGFKIDLAGAGMVSEKGDYYFKVNNASDLLDQALKSEYGKLYAGEPSLQPLVVKVKAFVKKIDGRWIKVEKSDITEFSTDYDKQQTCIQKAVKKFYDTDKQQQQIIDAYDKHRFIVIKNSDKPNKTINGQDSVAYDVKLDIKKSNEFGKAAVKTDIFKQIEKCDTSSTQASDSDMTSKEIKKAQKEADKVKVTAWVSRWSHQFTRVEVRGSEDARTITFGANIDQNKAPNLKDPSNPLKAKDLMKDLQSISQEAGMASANEPEEFSTASAQEF